MQSTADNLVKLFERGTLSGAMLAKQLVDFSPHDPSIPGQVIAAIEPKELFRILEALYTYPVSDFGWSILPLTREIYSRPDLSSQELGDLGSIHFQEDRRHVESLRAVIEAIVRR